MFRQTSSLVDRSISGRSVQRGLVSAEHPPSPPDTESLSSYAGPRRPSHPDNCILPTIPATPDMHESAGVRFRRLAGIPSHTSGSREFRGASRPQTRWLVVLIPPSHLVNELSVGHRSPGKLSSGLLVPLFPTLFAQLAAIAKEFSLPSTTGLCLYLHLPDGPETPRITDDVWPLLWSRHLHTDDASLPLGLPVAGRVQFDIDIPSARWYPMWFAHVSRKELIPDLARAVPSSPRPDPATDLTTRASRAPRPLALVPRQESVIAVQLDSSPSPAPSPSKLSIPRSASKETVEKVKHWSALVTPDPPALRPDDVLPPRTGDSTPPSTGDQPPTGTTAAEDAEPEPEPELEPLNLQDFQWSISSAGPSSPASSCATTASSRVPSIHLLERIEGSVILTPTTATSWGPQYDSDIESDLELDTEWRVRSPDVGERAEGSVLLTPSTATTWGAPLSYPPTPAHWDAQQVHTPDLGRRGEGSVLLTPSTATTWGAPLSYPPTPEAARAREWVPSPGLADTDDLTPGRVGRMSTMHWSNEVETEEQAYTRMGLTWRWELGWPAASPLPGVREVEEQDEEPISSQATPVDNEDSRSVGSARSSVREPFVAEVQVAPEEHHEDEESLSEQEDGVESIYSDPFGQDEMQEEVHARAFEFELELESPQVGGVIEQSSYAEEVHETYDVEFGGVVDGFDHQERYSETLDHVPEDVSDISDSDASTPSIGGEVFEYSFPESAAEPAFPVSVSASEDVGFPGLDLTPEPESPLDAAISSWTRATAVRSLATVSLATTATIAAAVTATAAPTATQSIPARSYGAYPYLVIYPSVYPHLDLYPTIPAANIQAERPALKLSTQPTGVALPPSSPSSASAVNQHSDSQESAPSPVDSIASQSTRLTSSSRKSSLSIHVPSNRSRSRSIIAVNPTDRRSLEWSRSLPPVPPVPRAARNGSIGSIRSIGSASSLGRMRQGSTGSLRSLPEENVVEIAGARDILDQPQDQQQDEGSHHNIELESLPSKKLQPQPQPSSCAYPYRYPENLEHIYPAKETLGYPANLERIYPLVEKPVIPAPRTLFATSSPATPVVATGTPGSNGSLANYSIRVYPVFDLYPAVYPYNLDEIYPPIPRNPIVLPAVAPAPLARTHALTSVSISAHKPQHVEISRDYPFIEPYPAVYPYNLEHLYPSFPQEVVIPKSVHNVASSPAQAQLAVSNLGKVEAAPFSDAYPFNLDNQTVSQIHIATVPAAKSRNSTITSVGVRLPRSYPHLEIYTPVYPYNLEVYSMVRAAEAPKVVGSSAHITSSPVQVQVAVPNPVKAKATPCPDAYPFNLDNIYPPVLGRSKPTTFTPQPRSSTVTSVGVRLDRSYPYLEIYTPVYPFNLEIYPVKPEASEVVDSPVHSIAPSPAQIQPTVSNLDKVKVAPSPQHVKISRGYPFIDPYPAVYPYNLEHLYPSFSKEVVIPRSAHNIVLSPTQIQQAAPNLGKAKTAPSSDAYPFNLDNIYPPVSGHPKPTASQIHFATVPIARPRNSMVGSVGVGLPRSCPHLGIYPPIYPFNLDIHPVVKATGAPNVAGSDTETKAVGSSPAQDESLADKFEKNASPMRKRKTHAQLCAETWRKSHAQLVVEVLEESTPARTRKSHAELEAEVFPDGLPAAVAPEDLASPRFTVTTAQSNELGPVVQPALKSESEPGPAPLPAHSVARLRRQRSGTIMRPSPAESLSAPQSVDLGRPRSVVEARAKMFERVIPARSQTIGPQEPRRTIIRQKSATFERAKSLFHVPEENQTQSDVEGSRTPPRPVRRVSKLDISKFGFA